MQGPNKIGRGEMVDSLGLIATKLGMESSFHIVSEWQEKRDGLSLAWDEA